MSDDALAMTVTAAVVRRAGAVLMASRPPGGHLAGSWEFPGGKPLPGEDLAAALRRELREELGLEVIVLDLLWRQRHRYPERTVDLRFFRCLPRHPDAVPSPREGQDCAWVPLDKLTAMRLVPADLPFARWLMLAR